MLWTCGLTKLKKKKCDRLIWADPISPVPLRALMGWSLPFWHLTLTCSFLFNAPNGDDVALALVALTPKTHMHTA